MEKRCDIFIAPACPRLIKPTVINLPPMFIVLLVYGGGIAHKTLEIIQRLAGR